MKTKSSSKCNKLVEIFQNHLGWNKIRVKLFVSFIFELCKVQTKFFSKLGQGFEDKAKEESNMQRIFGFFASFILDTNVIVI